MEIEKYLNLIETTDKSKEENYHFFINEQFKGENLKLLVSLQENEIGNIKVTVKSKKVIEDQKLVDLIKRMIEVDLEKTVQ